MVYCELQVKNTILKAIHNDVDYNNQTIETANYRLKIQFYMA